MLRGRSDAGFKSFEELASRITSAPEHEATREKIDSPQPVEEKAEAPQTDSVVSRLIEKLSEADDKSLLPLNESNTLEEIEVPLDDKKLEEALANLIKRIDKLPIAEEASETRSEPIKETKKPEELGKAYRVFRDRDESFECNLSVEGTSLADSKVRLVLESDAWNFIFYGKVYGDGRCVVPIKKGIPLVEGATGKIKLEIVAEDQLFIGWEDTFKIAASKKVKVDLKEQKSVTVSFNKPLNEKG